MNNSNSSGLTVVGGRPDDQEDVTSTISPGLQALLDRLAENPRLAHDLVTNPERTLAAEGLTLTPAELAMLHHLDVQDLGQTRAMTRGGEVRALPMKRIPLGVDEETRRRLAAQLELVAPFVADSEFYMRPLTRGIRPQSIYPTPFAVAEALLRTSEDFRAAFMDNPRQAVLNWSDLPLSDLERQTLLSEPILTRLKRAVQDV